MAHVPYSVIAASKPFQILVGPEEKSFIMHSELLANVSKPLYALVHGEMREAKDGVAVWPEVDEAIFVRFWEFVYTGDYIVVASNSCSGKAGPKGKAEDRIAPSLKKKGKSSTWGDNADDWGLYPPTEKLSKRSQLLRSFKKLDYTVPVPEKLPAESSSTSMTTPSDLFLFHARIYVLADYYDIRELRMLSLKRLHQALVEFEMSKDRVDDVIGVIDYCFANTVDKCGNQDGLRHLLTLYAACNIETMWLSPKFQGILEGSGEVSKAIIGHMLSRLD